MRLSKPARWLARLWGAVILALTAGAAALLIAGSPKLPIVASASGPEVSEAPPADRAPEPQKAAPQAVTERTAPESVPSPRSEPPSAPKTADARGRPGRESPGSIADPDPALLDPQGPGQAVPLPRIAADGRTASQVYAAGFDRTNMRPRVAILLGGIGLSDTESEAALKALPPAVSVAMSPYTVRPDRLLGVARLTRHEILLAVPMEPQGFPQNDAGEKSLKTSLPAEENAARLTWAMTRFAGYAGLTDALGQLRGERFAGSVTAMQPVVAAMATRGLFWLDARAGSAPVPGLWSRGADVVVDESAASGDVDARLGQLELIARDHGSAVGLVLLPRAQTVARLASWASAAAERGVTLAPISAVMRWSDADTRADSVRAAK